MLTEQKLFEIICSWVQGLNPDAIPVINYNFKNFHPIAATYIKQIAADTEAEKLQFLNGLRAYIASKLLNPNPNPIQDPDWGFVRLYEFVYTELLKRTLYTQQQQQYKISLLNQVKTYIINCCLDPEILLQDIAVLHNKTHRISNDPTIRTEIKIHNILEIYSWKLLLELVNRIESNTIPLESAGFLCNNIQAQLYNIKNKLSSGEALTTLELEMFAVAAWSLNRYDILSASVAYGLRLPHSNFFISLLIQNHDNNVTALLVKLTSNPERVVAPEPPMVTEAAPEQNPVMPEPEPVEEVILEPNPITPEPERVEEVIPEPKPITPEPEPVEETAPEPEPLPNLKVTKPPKPVQPPRILSDTEKLYISVQQLKQTEFNNIVSIKPELISQIKAVIISKLNEKSKDKGSKDSFFREINLPIADCVSICKDKNLSKTAKDILIKKLTTYSDAEFCEYLQEKFITDLKTSKPDPKNQAFMQIQKKIKSSAEWLNNQVVQYTQFIANNTSQHSEAKTLFPIATTEHFNHVIKAMPLYSHPVWQKLISIDSNSEQSSEQYELLAKVLKSELTFYDIEIPDNNFNSSIFAEILKQKRSIALISVLTKFFKENFDVVVQKDNFLLHNLIKNCNDAMFAWFLEQIDKEHFKTIINKQDQNKHTPLFVAIYNGHESKAKELLKHGANEEPYINNKEPSGSTIFTVSMIRGLTDIALYFLKYSSLVTENITKDGDSALHIWAKFTPHNKILFTELLERALKDRFKMACHMNNSNSTFVHTLLENPEADEKTALDALQHLFNRCSSNIVETAKINLIKTHSLIILQTILFAKNDKKQTIFTMAENLEYTQITKFLSEKLVEQIRTLNLLHFYETPRHFTKTIDYFSQQSTDSIIITKFKEKRYDLAQQYIALRRKTRDDIYNIFLHRPEDTADEKHRKDLILSDMMRVFCGEDYVSMYIGEETLFSYIFDVENKGDDIEDLRNSQAIQKIVKMYPATHLKCWLKVFDDKARNQEGWRKNTDIFIESVKKYGFDIARRDIKDASLLEDLICINDVDITKYMFKVFNIIIRPIHLIALATLSKSEDSLFENFDYILQQYHKQRSEHNKKNNCIDSPEYPDWTKIVEKNDNGLDLLECAVFKSFNIDTLKWLVRNGYPLSKIQDDNSNIITRILSNVYFSPEFNFKYCYDLIKIILEKDDVAFKLLTHKTEDDITPLSLVLMFAPITDTEENMLHKIIKLMVAKGSDIANVTKKQENIFHHAAVFKKASCKTVELLESLVSTKFGLRKRDEMLNQKNELGLTPQNIFKAVDTVTSEHKTKLSHKMKMHQ